MIVDSKTNRLVNRGRETALADARSLTPQALADPDGLGRTQTHPSLRAKRSNPEQHVMP
nr:hypothetical protein [Sphingomonas sp. BT553]